MSIGDKTIAESEEEIKERMRVANGEEAVRISAVMDDALSSSGRPTTAAKRLRIKVFSVGRSREYMKVALVAFHGAVGPLVDHNCDTTSINDDGSLIDMAYLREDGDGRI